MATHSSVLAWRISGTGEPGGLSSMGSHRVGHNWSDAAAAAYVCVLMKSSVNDVVIKLTLAAVCAQLLQYCPTLCDPMDCSLPGSSCPWNSPGKSTGVGCHVLLQGIFLTQGFHAPLGMSPAQQAESLLLSHPGSPAPISIFPIMHNGSNMIEVCVLIT